MIKYRPHRGGLDESMAEMKTFINIANMLRHIEKETRGANSTILKIDIDDLREEVLGRYVTKDKYSPINSMFENCLDFNKIVEDEIDAVQLMDGRLGHYFMANAYEFMFNTWDCESIVVLNKDVIEFV